MPTTDTELQEFKLWVGTTAQIEAGISGGDIGQDDFAVTTDGGDYLTTDYLTGMVLPFAGSQVPDGWLVCDGSAISRTTYADLFSVIGTAYGSGNGSTTFNLPNNNNIAVWGVASANDRGSDFLPSLPSITGKMNTWSYTGSSIQPSGSFKRSADTNVETYTGGVQYNGFATEFDASVSSAVYGRDGNTDNVYPPRTTYLMIIKY